MHTEKTIYHHDKQALHGHLAFDNTHANKRPAVLVFHDWSGRNAFAIEQAEKLPHMGYVGFAADMYGDGHVAKTVEEKQALMTPLIEERTHLLKRVHAAFDVVSKRPEVDPLRIAAIGFCFGGLCVLDLARSTPSLKAAVSFHGLLHRPEKTTITPIQTQILALHGYDDPMVPPEQTQAFSEEMTEAGADWQLHTYGQTTHAFTNPEANDPASGTQYNPRAANRAFQSMHNFLTEVLA